MLTVSAVLLKSPSFTTSENVSRVSAVMDGPVNVGFCAVASDSVIVGPAVCVHEYVMVSPFGSNEPLPSSVTSICSLGVWSGPASAIGAILSKIFVIVQTAFSFTDSEIVLVENGSL